jgi:hypothetical protein
MNAIRIEKQLDSHILPELIPWVGKRVEIIVLEQPSAKPPISLGRKAGSAKGMLTISPDFDDPLPEFDEYTK